MEKGTPDPPVRRRRRIRRNRAEIGGMFGPAPARTCSNPSLVARAGRFQRSPRRLRRILPATAAAATAAGPSHVALRHPRDEVLSFVRAVKKTLKNDKDKYATFKRVVTDFLGKRIGAGDFSMSVQHLIHGHLELLDGLYAFEEITVRAFKDDARAYLYMKDVEIWLKNDKDKFDEFLEVLKGFKAQKIGVFEVTERVKSLFLGHDEYMIIGFNSFLPAGYKIRLAVIEVGREEELALFDHAINYMKHSVSFFQNDKHQHAAFLEILFILRKGNRPLTEVCREVAHLFTRQDLAEELKSFVGHVRGFVYLLRGKIRRPLRRSPSHHPTPESETSGRPLRRSPSHHLTSESEMSGTPQVLQPVDFEIMYELFKKLWSWEEYSLPESFLERPSAPV